MIAMDFEQHTEHERREHQGGCGTNHYEAGELVSATDFDFDLIDKALGYSEPETAGNDLLDLTIDGITKIAVWQISEFKRVEKIKNFEREIIMRPQMAAYLRAICLVLFLQPDALGLKNPTIRELSCVTCCSPQAFGRVWVAFRDTYKLTTTTAKSDECRAILSLAQIQAREKARAKANAEEARIAALDKEAKALCDEFAPDFVTTTQMLLNF